MAGDLRMHDAIPTRHQIAAEPPVFGRIRIGAEIERVQSVAVRKTSTNHLGNGRFERRRREWHRYVHAGAKSAEAAAGTFGRGRRSIGEVSAPLAWRRQQYTAAACTGAKRNQRSDTSETSAHRMNIGHDPPGVESKRPAATGAVSSVAQDAAVATLGDPLERLRHHAFEQGSHAIARVHLGS